MVVLEAAEETRMTRQAEVVVLGVVVVLVELQAYTSPLRMGWTLAPGPRRASPPLVP